MTFVFASPKTKKFCFLTGGLKIFMKQGKIQWADPQSVNKPMYNWTRVSDDVFLFKTHAKHIKFSSKPKSCPISDQPQDLAPAFN